jgi:hypothetical protein
MFSANPNIGVLDPFEAKTVPIHLFRNLCRSKAVPCHLLPKNLSNDNATIFFNTIVSRYKLLCYALNDRSPKETSLEPVGLVISIVVPVQQELTSLFP